MTAPCPFLMRAPCVTVAVGSPLIVGEPFADDDSDVHPSLVSRIVSSGLVEACLRMRLVAISHLVHFVINQKSNL